jgi:phosphomannomutase
VPLQGPPRDLYRGYDIRGLAGIDLTIDAARAMGSAFAAYAAAQSATSVYLGYDGRPSGKDLAAAVVSGLVDGGAEVIELGVVPTPLVYFASSQAPGSFGVAVTASHLAAEWNGLKFCRGSMPIHTDVVRELVERGPRSASKAGTVTSGRNTVIEGYRAMLAGVTAGVGDLSIVLDCQNAAASAVAPYVFRALGLNVDTIYTDLGAGYPFTTPDPQVADHLEPLRTAVSQSGAAIGFAFDGDADRLGVVDETGRRIPADVVLALLAEDVVSRHPGAAIVYDVLSSPVVEQVVGRAGGRPVEAPSGHAFVQDMVRDEAAPLGGEGSGHIFFADGYRGQALGYDDAIYAAARLVEYVHRLGPIGPRVDALPRVVAGDEWRPHCPDNLKRKIVDDVARSFRESGYRVTEVDGVKAHFGPLAWALVRAANTEPVLSVRVVGPNPQDVAGLESRIKEVVRNAAARYDVSL